MTQSFSIFVCRLRSRFVFAAGAVFLGAGLALGSSCVARAQQTDTSGLQHILEQAQAEQKNGDLAAAARDYKAALQVDPRFAEVRVNLGLVYQLQDRLPEAMAEFVKALRIRSTLPGANFFLGVDYCKQGQSAKAIPYLKAAAKEQPEKKDIWIWLATAQELSGQIEAQAATLRHGLTIFPNDADLLYKLGAAYEKLGKNTVDQLSMSKPPSFRSEELLGKSYASSSEWPVAVLHFQNAIALSPAAAGLHTELGEVYLHAGNWGAAKPQFDAELQLNPRSVPALARRGEAEIVQGGMDGALRDWAQAVTIDRPQAERVLGISVSDANVPAEQLPDEIRRELEALLPQLRAQATPEAEFAVDFIAAQSGDPWQSSTIESDSASGGFTETSHAHCTLKTLRQELDEGRESRAAACARSLGKAQLAPSLRVQVAAIFFDLSDQVTSLEMLEGLPTAEAKSADALYWRARSCEQLSTHAFLTLSRAHPDSFRVHQLLGDVAEAKGDDDKAIEEYRAAIAQNPSAPGLHYTLGHILWKDLKVPEARQELEAELALNPHNAGALEDMGDTFLLEHQPEKALTYLKPALAADGQNPDVHRDLGTAYFDLRKLVAAESEFKIALPSDHDGSVHYKLARVYQALGEKDKASQEFAISTEMNRESHAKLEKRTERLTEIEKSSREQP